MNTSTLSLDLPARYRLRLQGHFNADWSDWLMEVEAIVEKDQTVITGRVRDQAALFGLLSFIRNLGAPLVLVEYLPISKTNEENVMKTNLFKTICNGIAVAMGVAVIVTNLVNPLSTADLSSLLALGLAALGVAALKN